jgi:hypothetical protein
MGLYDKLYQQEKARTPRLTVMKRSDSTFMKVIFWPLEKITGRSYANFGTTIGSTFYAPANWDDTPDQCKYMMLRHEIMHVRQFNYWPCGKRFWWLNYFIVAFLYLLCFPVLLTCRAMFEREGYIQSALVAWELGVVTKDYRDTWAHQMAEIFGSSTYLYMWTRGAAEKWAQKTWDDIVAGKIKNDLDRMS